MGKYEVLDNEEVVELVQIFKILHAWPENETTVPLTHDDDVA